MKDKYNFRLSSEIKEDLDECFPPRQHGQSKFIDESLFDFFDQGKQPLADRPHLRGRVKAYKQVCALIDTEHQETAKRLYPDVSISVVFQAAIASGLRKHRDKIGDLQKGNTPVLPPNDEQNPNDYSCAGGSSRNLATALD